MNKWATCDSSFLINFIRINRLDLFEKSSYTFVITDHVEEEITNCFQDQLNCLNDGLNRNILQKVNVESSQEFSLFAELHKSGQLGTGECAAIAVAACREFILAIDDNLAIKKTKDLIPLSNLLRTQDFLLKLIDEQQLEIDEADRLKEMWETQHRFKLKINSFRDLIIHR